jgi:membrane carboxypeptidase/penicillin-binding protein
VAGEPLPEPERALSPQVAYIVNAVLQGVLDRGTGASVRAHGVRDALAGKTGTTNGRRDSWFGGYAPSRATMVWVGYDDNSATRLSGARAALPIWARFTVKARPPGGFPRFPQPRGVVTAVVDPWSGELATEACPEVLTEVFLEGQVPNSVCHLHGGWFADVLAPIPGAPPGSEQARPAERGEYEELDRRGFRRWLRKVFGKQQDDRPRRWKNPPPPPPPPPPVR